ncbi:RDD family protein [Saccharopolyspora sp. NPDC002376]
MKIGPASMSATEALSTGRRVGAWIVDFMVVVVVGVVLAIVTYQRLVGLFSSVPGLVYDSVWAMVAGQGDLTDTSARFGRSVWRSAVLYVQEAFFALVLITFAYQFAGLAVLKGRTVGNVLFDVRVLPIKRSALGFRKAAIRAFMMTLTDIGLFATACCLLVQGWVVFAVMC